MYIPFLLLLSQLYLGFASLFESIELLLTIEKKRKKLLDVRNVLRLFILLFSHCCQHICCIKGLYLRHINQQHLLMVVVWDFVVF